MAPGDLERTAEAPGGRPGDLGETWRGPSRLPCFISKSRPHEKFSKLIQQTDETNKHKTEPKQLKNANFEVTRGTESKQEMRERARRGGGDEGEQTPGFRPKSAQIRNGGCGMGQGFKAHLRGTRAPGFGGQGSTWKLKQQTKSTLCKHRVVQTRPRSRVQGPTPVRSGSQTTRDRGSKVQERVRLPANSPD